MWFCAEADRVLIWQVVVLSIGAQPQIEYITNIDPLFINIIWQILSNGSTTVWEGAKPKSGQRVVKKLKWTYFDAFDVYDIFDSVRLLSVSFCRGVAPEFLWLFF